MMDFFKQAIRGFKGRLFEHQMDSLMFMVDREKGKYPPFGGMIFDDMGLGKTCSGILCMLSDPGLNLVVVPKSLIHQWKDAIERFSDIKVFISRSEIIEAYTNELPFDSACVIISYSQVQHKTEFYTFVLELQFKRMFLDEAHIVRNQKTKTYQHLESICREHTWVLTGTPVHNKNDDFKTYLLL